MAKAKKTKKVVSKKKVKAAPPPIPSPLDNEPVIKRRQKQVHIQTDVGKKWTRYDYEKIYAQRAREAANDIGEIPLPANPERKKECENNLVLFCNTYLKEHFYRKWSENQIYIAQEVERVVQEGGKQAIAAKRRGAKTTICRGALLWAILYGKHKWAYYMAATEDKSLSSKSFFEFELAYNDVLLEDFPEACIPMRKMDNVRQRKLTYKGDTCAITISGNSLQLPTIRMYDKKGKLVKDKAGNPVFYPCSGALIDFVSINSSIRGGNKAIIGQGSVRPSLALVDDPQNDGAAKSETQIRALEDVVTKGLGEMSGYDRSGLIKPPSLLVTVTCIQVNDFACRILDKDLYPSFNGILFRRFTTMPINMNLWQEYRELYKKDGGESRYSCNDREATKFYIKNRAAMDEGAVVDDENDYTLKHLSAVQYGMDRWCENEKSFWTEHQNDPEKTLENLEGLLTPSKVMEKTRRFMNKRHFVSYRHIIPDNTETMTAFIDVGQHYLNYEVTAFGHNYSFAHVVDCGWFPDQKGVFNITKSNFNVDIQSHYRNGSVEDKIARAVYDCLNKIFKQPYFDEGGKEIDVHRLIDYYVGREQMQAHFLSMVGVDANDHKQEYSVWTAIANWSQQESLAFPCYGRAIPCYGMKTSTRHMRDFDLKPNEWQRGRNEQDHGDGDWIEYPSTKKSIINEFKGIVHSCLIFEANTYRTMRDIAWKTSIGEYGCQTLFDDAPHILDQYSKQQCSCSPKVKNLPGSEYLEWEKNKKTAVYDKEFFDTNMGCFLIASYVGLNPNYGETNFMPTKVIAPRMSWIERMRQNSKESNQPQNSVRVPAKRPTW
jgi:hypothetical protein